MEIYQNTQSLTSPDFRTNAENAIFSVLSQHNIPTRPAGPNEIAFPAVWRGGRNPNVSINLLTGLWNDHKEDRGGNFSQLRRLLGGSGSDTVYEFESPSGEALEALKKEQTEKRELKERIADRVWKAGFDIKTPGSSSRSAQRRRLSLASAQAEALSIPAIAYLESRQINWLWIRKYVRLAQPHEVYDAAEIEAGAVAILLAPMFQNREYGKKLVGLQRTYLDQNGRKITRKMFGSLGWLRLDPAGTPIPLPSPAKTLFLGEGLETVATIAQATKCPGLVAFNAAGMVRVANEMHETTAGQNVGVLVDRDLSMAGQNFSARAAQIIRNKGYEATYLVPGDAVAGGPKGADWADTAGKGIDFVVEQLIHAWHKASAEEAKIEIPDDTTISIKPTSWRPAQAPVEIKTPGSVDEGYGEMIVRLSDAMSRFAEYTKAKNERRREQDYRASLRKDDPEVKFSEPLPELPKFSPVGFMVTTGVGKSRAIRESMHDMGGPVLILVGSHQEAKAYVEAGAFGYHGRAPAEEGNKNNPDWGCFKMLLVQAVAQRNHAPAATACSTCEHGHRDAFERASDEKRADILDRMEKKGLTQEKFLKLPPCLWIAHQRKARSMPVVVAAVQGFSDTLATYVDENGVEHDRLVIVDESTNFTRPNEVTTKEIADWAARIDDMKTDINEGLENGSFPEDKADDYRATHSDLETALDFMRQLGQWIGKNLTHKGPMQVPDELAETIKNLKIRWKSGGTAVWERVEETDDAYIIPLRAVRAMIQSTSHKIAELNRGTIIVHETSQLLERVANGKKPTILLDATLSHHISQAIIEAGGHVVDATARQNIKVSQAVGKLHGRSGLKDKKRIGQMIENLLAYKATYEKEVGEDVAVLTYKAITENLEKDDDELWGYHGNDDIAHDRWNGRHLLIHGSTILPPDEARVLYNSARMIALEAGDDQENWPWWDGSVVRNQWITVGDKEVFCRAPLPADQRVRAWFFDTYTSRIVQAIGRVRGARFDGKTREIRILGGLPLVGTEAHGINVDYFAEEGRTRQEYHNDRRKDAFERIELAHAVLSAISQNPTYAAICTYCQSKNLKTPRRELFKDWNDNRRSTRMNDVTMARFVVAAMKDMAKRNIENQQGVDLWREEMRQHEDDDPGLSDAWDLAAMIWREYLPERTHRLRPPE